MSELNIVTLAHFVKVNFKAYIFAVLIGFLLSAGYLSMTINYKSNISYVFDDALEYTNYLKLPTFLKAIESSQLDNSKFSKLISNNFHGSALGAFELDYEMWINKSALDQFSHHDEKMIRNSNLVKSVIFSYQHKIKLTEGLIDSDSVLMLKNLIQYFVVAEKINSAIHIFNSEISGYIKEASQLEEKIKQNREILDQLLRIGGSDIRAREYTLNLTDKVDIEYLPIQSQINFYRTKIISLEAMLKSNRLKIEEKKALNQIMLDLQTQLSLSPWASERVLATYDCISLDTKLYDEIFDALCESEVNKIKQLYSESGAKVSEVKLNSIVIPSRLKTLFVFLLPIMLMSIYLVCTKEFAPNSD